MNADSSDQELIFEALSMKANLIETGDPNLSAMDAKEAKLPFNALDLNQMKLIIRLRELAETMRS